MKKLLVLVLAMTVASSAFAIIDPDPNSLGFYFDLTADTVEVQDAGINSQHTMYVILTNPTFQNLGGIEYGYVMEGSAFVLSNVWANPQALDIGSAGNHIVGFGAPTPTTEATLIATMTVLFLDPVAVNFTLTGTVPSSLDPALPTLLTDGDVLMSSGDSTDIGNINATINGATPVATDPVSFDAVKSLYR